MASFNTENTLGAWLAHSTHPKEITNQILPIATGQNLVSGTVMGKVSATGLYTKCNTAAVDGSQTPTHILYNAVNANATYATGATGTGDTEIVYTAAQPGTQGNQISIALIDPAANNSALAVTIDGDVLNGYSIEVSLATDGGGLITTTSGDLTAPFAALLSPDFNRPVVYAADSGNDTDPLTEDTVTLTGGLYDEVNNTGVGMKLMDGILVYGSNLVFSGVAATIKTALEAAGVVYAVEG